MKNKLPLMALVAIFSGLSIARAQSFDCAPPAPEKIRQDVMGFWESDQFSEAEVYIDGIVAAFPNYTPVYLISAFKNLFYYGNYNAAKSDLDQAYSAVENESGAENARARIDVLRKWLGDEASASSLPNGHGAAPTVAAATMKAGLGDPPGVDPPIIDVLRVVPVGKGADAVLSVSVTSPPNGGVVSGGGGVDVLASATVDTGRLCGVEVRVSGQLVGSDRTEPFLVRWDGATPGTYSLQAKVYDYRGHSAESQLVTVSVE